MSLDLLQGVSAERVKTLLEELSYDNLCGLLFAKAAIEKKRVDIRTRPLEARVRVKKRLACYCPKSPAECIFDLATELCLFCGRRVGISR